jgi:hypothetical protein
MEKKRLLIYFAVLLIGLIISFYTIRTHFDVKTIVILLFFLIFIPTLINPDIGLIIIIVSMLFSPDVIIGKTAYREISVRIEDIFLILIVLAGFLRIAFTKDLAEVFKTKLTLLFFYYIAVCLMSTVFAVIFGGAEMPLGHSLFSILKYLEYFLLFLMVKDNMRNLRQPKLFVAIFLLTALSVAVYSNIYIGQQQAAGIEFFRTRPPVETMGGGEAGTLGGYLVFMMAIAGGLLIYARSMPIRIFLIILELLMFRGFLYSLSRGSYLAFVPMVIMLIYFMKKEKLLVICIFICISIGVIFYMPSMVRSRISTTLTIKKEVDRTYNIQWEESPRARIESWQMVLFQKFPKSPIIGHGVGRYFIDSQLFSTLCEVGLAGLILFGLVLFRLFTMAINVLNDNFVENDNFSVGLTTGFLAGYVGLLAHAISTNTFIIIRVMEPFWFIAAIVLSLPQLLGQEKPVAEETGLI